MFVLYEEPTTDVDKKRPQMFPMADECRTPTGPKLDEDGLVTRLGVESQ